MLFHFLAGLDAASSAVEGIALFRSIESLYLDLIFFTLLDALQDHLGLIRSEVFGLPLFLSFDAVHDLITPDANSLQIICADGEFSLAGLHRFKRGNSRLNLYGNHFTEVAHGNKEIGISTACRRKCRNRIILRIRHNRHSV